jgi:hypothetical protein
MIPMCYTVPWCAMDTQKAAEVAQLGFKYVIVGSLARLRAACHDELP